MLTYPSSLSRSRIIISYVPQNISAHLYPKSRTNKSRPFKLAATTITPVACCACSLRAHNIIYLYDTYINIYIYICPTQDRNHRREEKKPHTGPEPACEKNRYLGLAVSAHRSVATAAARAKFREISREVMERSRNLEGERGKTYIHIYISLYTHVYTHGLFSVRACGRRERER